MASNKMIFVCLAALGMCLLSGQASLAQSDKGVSPIVVGGVIAGAEAPVALATLDDLSEKELAAGGIEVSSKDGEEVLAPPAPMVVWRGPVNADSIKPVLFFADGKKPREQIKKSPMKVVALEVKSPKEPNKEVVEKIRQNFRQAWAKVLQSRWAQAVRDFKPQSMDLSETRKAVLAPDGKHGYIQWVQKGGGLNVSRLNLANGKVMTGSCCLETSRTGTMAIDQKGNNYSIWVADNGNLMFARFSPEKNELKRCREIAVAGIGNEPYELIVSPDGNAMVIYNAPGLFSTGPVIAQVRKGCVQEQEVELTGKAADRLVASFLRGMNRILVVWRDKDAKKLHPVEYPYEKGKIEPQKVQKVEWGRK